MKHTKWYEFWQRPARTGVYKTEHHNQYTQQPYELYSYWDGRFWYQSAGFALAAQCFYELGRISLRQHYNWCGLTKQYKYD